jgi:CDP-glycerol glycerophosphotransferase
MYLLLPVRPEVVVFMSNLGRNYSGNPKSIYEEMLAVGDDKKYRCYYILENKRLQLPGKIKPVRMGRIQFYYVMAVAGTIISDTRFPNHIRKRKQAMYLQTWHGTPLKKLALDMNSYNMAGGETKETYQREFKKNSATWDYLISQNDFSSHIFRRAFAFDGEILEIGYPRNDILFKHNNTDAIQALKLKYQLPVEKKILLYAPTWRDNSFYDKESYRMNAPLDYDYLYEMLSKEYIILIKYHYMVREKLDFSEYNGFYRVMDSSYDISELSLASDMLITDYSSVMFDYSILKRPMIFYVYDIKEYEEELRGFYFDFIKEAPGPFVMTTQELAEQILSYEGSSYQERYHDFSQKYHSFENGKAAEKVLQILEKKRFD